MSDEPESAVGPAPEDLFRWGAVSDVGRVRDVNQDSMFVRDGLFVVADGMGGHRGGEVASAVAVGVMKQVGDDPSIDQLVDAVNDANEAVLERAATDPALIGMGTTLCAVARLQAAPDDDPEGPRLGVVNVGDSRVYVFADGELLQVSEDHSLVAEMVRGGQITPEEAAIHPQRNVVTRALGIGDELDIDYWELPARTGDRYVLSSDGLFDEVTEAQIASVLRRLADPEEAATELVRLANESGARDNVTVVVVDVVGGIAGAPAVLPGFPSVDARTTSSDPEAGPDAAGGSGAAALDGGDRDDAAPAEPQRRWLRRYLSLIVTLVVVAAIILGFVARYARDNYFVTFEQGGVETTDNSQVVIFQGRPGGVLWFDPTVEERTPILGLDLNDALVLELEQIPEFDTLEAAQRYVVGLTTRASDAG